MNERDGKAAGPNFLPGPDASAYVWIWISAYKASAFGEGRKVYDRILSGYHHDNLPGPYQLLVWIIFVPSDAELCAP